MELLSGGDMLVRALADEGVEHVFGYPGGAVLHIYDAFFRQDKINHYLVRHEQAAGHMADAYSRVTGKTGVVVGIGHLTRLVILQLDYRTVVSAKIAVKAERRQVLCCICPVLPITNKETVPCKQCRQ